MNSLQINLESVIYLKVKLPQIYKNVPERSFVDSDTVQITKALQLLDNDPLLVQPETIVYPSFNTNFKWTSNEHSQYSYKKKVLFGELFVFYKFLQYSAQYLRVLVSLSLYTFR